MIRTVNVGIDLGTTNTLCCLQDNQNKVSPIRFMGTGNDINLPSVIYYDGGKTIVGRRALEKLRQNPDNGYASSKTQIGSDARRVLNGKVFTPTDAAACILAEVKDTVQRYAKKWYNDDEVEIEAVITYPAYFSQSQIDETQKAGEIAGIKVKKLISEPMAAALAYISDEDLESADRRILAIDLGGGTFDLSLLKYNASSNSYDALGTGGDPNLGGDDFDQTLIDGFVDTIEFETDGKINLKTEDTANQCGIDRCDYLSAMALLKKEAEQLKIHLSSNDSWSVVAPGLINYSDGDSYDFTIEEYTRETFDEICQPLYDRIFGSIERFCKEYGVTADNIWRVALVGGSCNIPYIQERIHELFPGKVYANKNLTSLVATGAYLASLDVTDSQNAIRYTDTLAHSLGIKVKGGKSGLFSEILSRQPYPCEATMTYKTVRDHQRTAQIDVYETRNIGEDDSLIENCRFYGTLVLDGLEDKKAGEVKIKVTLKYSESRTLTITAEDVQSGRSRSVELKKASGFSAKPTASRPLDIMLMIDKSGSMNSSATPNSRLSKLDEAKRASSKLINQMVDLSVNRIGILSFGDQISLDCPLTHDKTKLTKCLLDIHTYGGTMVTRALQYVTRNVFNSQEIGADRYAIILTDGRPSNDGNPIEAARQLEKNACRIITIGVGLDDRGADFNRQIASLREDGTPFTYNIDTMSQLADVFYEIIGELQPQ